MDEELSAQRFAVGVGAGAAVTDRFVELDKVGPRAGIGVPDEPKP
ncbi:hypothetical protein P3102_19010 [Amycolatopsis sp. QT-25]|nr:hypothetical protein [Amycolatopsis sp. QT-25]WET76227.1 hypothetical protein P3102_19010 [Amycolatopsis sp. QT-25]